MVKNRERIETQWLRVCPALIGVCPALQSPAHTSGHTQLTVTPVPWFLIPSFPLELLHAYDVRILM